MLRGAVTVNVTGLTKKCLSIYLPFVNQQTANYKKILLTVHKCSKSKNNLCLSCRLEWSQDIEVISNCGKHIYVA